LLYVLPSNYSALTAIYTPSLHDALPISRSLRRNPFDFEIILVGLGQLVRRSETPLVEQFRVDIADSGNRVERSARVTCLFFGFGDRKSTRLNSSHGSISYAVFCLKKKNR